MKFLLLCVISVLATNVQGINNGVLASINQHKYVVAIHTKILGACTISTCTGSIIHERFILTAAHCFTSKVDGSDKYKFDGWPVTVYANTDTLDRNPNAIERKVRKIYFKPEWFVTGAEADIAILELDENLDFAKNGKYLERIDLPEKVKVGNKFHYKTYDNELALLTGYGLDNVGRKNTENKLKRMFIKVIDFFFCKRAYTSSKYLNKDGVLCGNAVEKVVQNGRTVIAKPSLESGPCEGDSGGPLVYNGNTQIGVLSRGSDNCDDRDNYPGVYMRVSHYIDFIDDALNNRITDERKIKYYDLNGIIGNVIDKCTKFVTQLRPLNNS